MKIYDPQTGKSFDLQAAIIRLGTQAVARKYGVSESTVYKWRKGLHRPSAESLSKASKTLF